MGIFSATSPFDADVEKATDEKNTNEEWGKIMDICDRVGKNSPQNAKDCLSSIIRRLRNADPHIAMQAATLLHACVNNCGKTFHLEVASRDFENEYIKLLHKSHAKVSEKLRQLLRTWAEGDFKEDKQLSLIPSLYQKLKRDGMEFPVPDSLKSPKSAQLPKDSSSLVSQREVDDIAKAIELSLKDVSTSPKGGKSKAGSSGSGLYPTTSLSTTPEGRKVRALYDFEAAEDNELTFKAGEIIHVTDDSDPNWWKGHNKRGEGLFPSNFVTADLSVEPEQTKMEKKSVQFNESVKIKKISKDLIEVEIDESKMDSLLHYLHEADPRDSSGDPIEMRELAEEVNAMGPLIDTELELVDRKHAQLTQLSSDLVEALNLYHTLMREPAGPTALPPYMPKPGNYGYMPPLPHSIPPQFTGNPGGSQPYVPSSYPGLPGSLPPLPSGPPVPQIMPEQIPVHTVNGVHQFGPPGAGPPPGPQQYHMLPQMTPVGPPMGPPGNPGPHGPVVAPNTHPSYHQL